MANSKPAIGGNSDILVNKIIKSCNKRSRRLERMWQKSNNPYIKRL